jgi:putative cell wall-binding protein
LKDYKEEQRLISFKTKASITLVFGLILSIFFVNGAFALERTSGKDRYETAVKISQRGWDKAGTVVLATGKNFPDSLAGGPLAFRYDAPILLTQPDALSKVTKDEIVRLEANDVIILGGKNAVSTNIEKELKTIGVSFRRISGLDRFATAARISDEIPSSQAIVVNGRNFPDALSISSYAAISQIPILLTEKDSIPSGTKNVLDNFGGSFVMGGQGVVSEKVFKQLPTPFRFGGTNRYETNRMTVQHLLPYEGWSEKAVVATGANFADALSGSVYAAKNDAPIILVKPEEVPSEVSSVLNNFHDYTVLGGKSAISNDVLQSISRYHNPFPDMSNSDNPVFSQVGKPVLSPDNQMTVTVDKAEVVKDQWFTWLKVTYTQKNNTLKTIDGGTFNLYHADHSSAYAYENFQYDTLQPGESKQRTYSFYLDHAEAPFLLEYYADFKDDNRPGKNTLKWVIE